MTDQWQPGKLYAPGDIVQPRITNPITQSAMSNATFEAGDTGWDTASATWEILQSDAYAGTWAARYSAGLIMAISGGGGFTDNVGVSSNGGLSWTITDTDFGASSPPWGYLNSGPHIMHNPATGTWYASDLLITGVLYESNDSGANWAVTEPQTGGMTSTRFSDFHPALGKFIAGEHQKLWESTDAKAWTQIATIDTTPASSAYDPTGNILLVDGATGSFVNYSDDGGVTWSKKATPFAATQVDWFDGLGLFTVQLNAGGSMATSPDGVNWTTGGAMNQLGKWGTMTYIPSLDRLVHVGFTGAEYSDDDGATWVNAAVDGGVNFHNVEFDAKSGNCIASANIAGADTNVWTSPDGDTWTERTVGTHAAYFQDMKFGASVALRDSSYMENDARLAVTPGQLVSGQAFAKISGNYSAHVGIGWYNSGGSLLSISWTDTPVTLAGAYRRVAAAGLAPDLAASCTVIVSVSGSGDEVRFDNATISHTNPVTISALLFKATQADPGYSDSFEPTWPTVVGNTVVDNEVTWEGVPANRVQWQAFPILVSGSSEPTWPATIGGEVADNTISWVADTRRIEDERCPNTKTVAITASKIFSGDADIIAYSATINPMDWTTPNDAGYIPFGLNTYGSQDVSALGLYRSNLVAFNSKGFQMWQVDEDPANFAILDAVPIGIPTSADKSIQPVSNDLVFLTEVGIRSMGIAGASTNLQAGSFGKQIDPLVKVKLDAGEVPISLYYPGAGQYWLIFGDEAFVLTMNGGKGDMSWSRYVFPSDIDDWTILDEDLMLRSGEKIWRVSELAERDDQVGDPASSGTAFVGRIHWPYLDMGRFGGEKQMVGFDLVATGAVTVQFGYDQSDLSKVTDAYVLAAGDTLPGTIVPMPITAPSFQLRLEFTADQSVAWEWQGAIIYIEDIGT